MQQSRLDAIVNKKGVPSKLVLWVPPAHITKIAMLSGLTKSKKIPGKYYVLLEPAIAYKILDAYEDGELDVSTPVAKWFATFQSELLTRLAPPEWASLDTAVPPNVDTRDYQLKGGAWLYSTKRGILGDPMGIGKTVQALLACAVLFRTQALSDDQKILVICPKEVAIKWAKACKFFLNITGIACIWGNKASRTKALEYAVASKEVKFIIVNYDMVNASKYPILFRPGLFKCVIPDEAHNLQGRTSIRRKSTHALVNHKTHPVEYVMMLTGSVISNRVDSIWALLNMLHPKRFTSYWRFVNQYCIVDETPFGPRLLGPDPDMLEQLQWTIGPYLLIRKKSEVLPELPLVTHTYMDYVPDDRVVSEYKAIVKWMASDEGVFNAAWLRRYLIMRDSMSWMIGENNDIEVPRKYQCTLPNVKMQNLMSFIEDAFNKKAIIFVYHREVAVFVHEYMQARFNGNLYLVTGAVKSELRHERLDEFVTTETPSILIGTISTIGTGIDLQVADLGIFLEHSYQSEINNQAVGRIERLGQKGHPVIAHFMGMGTIEQSVFEVAAEKNAHTTQVLAMEDIRKRTLELLVD